jgi:hypothetical protein
MYWQQWSSGWGQRRLTGLCLVNITPSPSLAFLCFFHKLLIFFFTSFSSSQSTIANLQSRREGGDGVEEPTVVEAGMEDHDDESLRQKKLEKGKELAAKDVDEEPLFHDSKFAVELLRSAFRELEGVGEAFDIKAHHDVYKDLSVKGLAFRIYGLAEKLENLPVVKQAARCHFVFDDGGSDGDDGSHDDVDSHGDDDGDDGSHGGGTSTN